MSPLLIATLSAVFVAAALLSGGATYVVLERTIPARRRLHHALAGGGETVAAAAGGSAVALRPNRTVERLAAFIPKAPADMNRLRRRLVSAGHHSLAAAVVFSVAECVLPLLLAVPAFMLIDWPIGLFAGVLAGSSGFLLPGVALARMIERRRAVISNGLPDVLDLFIVCLEAGCSLDQAIVKASDELALAYPPLADELRMIVTETRAGKPRIEAFRNFSARTKNADVRALVAMLVQADRFGVSVSQALRTFADVARTKRRQRAEERAAKVGVKLVFPLVLFLFPALYVVTLGPAIIQIARVFFGQVLVR